MGILGLGFKLKQGKALKEGTKAIKSVKPGTKFKGQKTVEEHKRDISHKKYIDSIRAAGDQITGNLKKSAQKLQKLNETLKKQKKILDD